MSQSLVALSSPMRRTPRWRAVVAWVLVVLVGLVVAYAGICIFSAHLLTRARGPLPALGPWMVGPGSVRWQTRTEDGLTLRGWYFPTSEKRQLIICVHGMNGDWTETAAVGRALHRDGFDLLLFDLRGHGASDGSRIFMGPRERADLRAVLAWARKEGFAPERIGWLGFSMGAATVLMEGAHDPDLRVAVLDSPYANLPELLDRELSANSGLPRFFNWGIEQAARYVFGVRTDNIIPLRDAPRWRDRPLLIIHGEADSVVPVYQARELARAAGCRLITLPGVEHIEAYQTHPSYYARTIVRFFRKHLAEVATTVSR